MALTAALKQVDGAHTGDMQHTVVTVASLSGVQEIEPNWVLCNGADLPAEARYDALVTKLGGAYGGARRLPSLISGVMPLPAGASHARGATGGAAAVTLGLGHIPEHTHSYSFMGVCGGGGGYGSGNGEGDESCDGTHTVSANGSGNAHNNMPPYVVVEGMLIRL